MKQEPLNRNNRYRELRLMPAASYGMSPVRSRTRTRDIIIFVGRKTDMVLKHRKTEKQKVFAASYGMSLIEFIIATALVGFVAISLVQVGEIALRASRFAGNRVAATFLLQEGVEETALLRDKSWNQNIAPRTTDVDYFLSFSGSEYSLSETPAPFIENTFARTIRFGDVGRNAQSDITPGGTTDKDAKKITVSVSWFEGGATTTEQIELYLTNLFKN